MHGFGGAKKFKVVTPTASATAHQGAAIEVLKRQVLGSMPKKPVTSVGGNRKPVKI